jgi:hypothetical protein
MISEDIRSRIDRDPINSAESVCRLPGVVPLHKRTCAAPFSAGVPHGSTHPWYQVPGTCTLWLIWRSLYKATNNLGVEFQAFNSKRGTIAILHGRVFSVNLFKYSRVPEAKYVIIYSYETSKGSVYDTTMRVLVQF